MGDTRQHVVTTSDGRSLAVRDAGVPDGPALVAQHGTPGTGRFYGAELASAQEKGLRLIAYDRPGYGGSTPNRGRTVADAADDVATILDALGVDRFATYGWSGGGPHALACAALLPDRVVRATCRVGVAPLGDSGLEQDEWLAGMDSENVKEFGWALAGEDVLTRELEAEDARIKERVAVDPSTALEGFDLSESDRAHMSRPETMQITRESTFERSRNGVGGWVDDDLAFLQPWGFEIAAISVPLLIWYGASDVLVPPAHGEWLASNVPGCLVKVDDAAGHMGANPVDEIAQNARWLSSGIAP
jgi:pimeloyl-ACP methyl ester carboxylesterase